MRSIRPSARVSCRALSGASTPMSVLGSGIRPASAVAASAGVAFSNSAAPPIRRIRRSIHSVVFIFIPPGVMPDWARV